MPKWLGNGFSGGIVEGMWCYSDNYTNIEIQNCIPNVFMLSLLCNLLMDVRVRPLYTVSHTDRWSVQCWSW